jgi:hypothetical protein
MPSPEPTPDELYEYRILRFTDGLNIEWGRCPQNIAARHHWEPDPSAARDPSRRDNARCAHQLPKPKPRPEVQSPA